MLSFHDPMIEEDALVSAACPKRYLLGFGHVPLIHQILHVEVSSFGLDGIMSFLALLSLLYGTPASLCASPRP